MRALLTLLLACALGGCGGGRPAAAPAPSPSLLLRVDGVEVRVPRARLQVGRLWRGTCVVTLEAGAEDPRLSLILPLTEAEARSLPGTALSWSRRPEAWDREGDNFAVVGGRTLDARRVRVRFERPRPGHVSLRLEGEFADRAGRTRAVAGSLGPVPYPRFREWGPG